MTPAEAVARAIHDTVEELAPRYGYEMKDGAVISWDEVPSRIRTLMIAVMADLLARGVIVAGDALPQ